MCLNRRFGLNRTFFIADPPTILVSPRNVLLLEGQQLTLFCNASGHPAPNVTWHKVGGGLLAHGETYTVNNVTRGHEGSYRCVVNNGEECDTDDAVALVTVNCKYTYKSCIKHYAMSIFPETRWAYMYVVRAMQTATMKGRPAG